MSNANPHDRVGKDMEGFPRQAKVVIIVAAWLTVAFIGLSWMIIKSELAPRRASAVSAIRQCARAQLVYAEDNSERLPPAPRWIDSMKNQNLNPSIFQPRLKRGDGDRYAFASNTPLGAMILSQLEAPESMGLVFATTKDERNANDNFSTLRWGVLGTGTFVAFADGSSKYIEPGQRLGSSSLNGPLRSR